LRRSVLVLVSIAFTALSACGGGGNSSYSAPNSTGSSNNGSGDDTYKTGVYLPSSSFANKCATPRTGTDPFSASAFPDVQGRVIDENNFLRSWTNETYLWYREVPDLNPASYTTTADYFPLLKTSADTASGSAKDKFHFTYPSSVWESLSQANTDIGYGLLFDFIANTPPRKLVVAYVEPGAAAGQAPASLARGATVLAIDGVDINSTTDSGIDTLNAGVSPVSAGETHTFTVQDVGSSASRTITLQSSNFVTKSVPLVQTISTATGNVGYLLFNDQLATAETQLIDAVNTLKSQGVTDLVLDIRYNGGGYLAIASELAYMIADPNMTAGQTFDLTQFNDKYPSTDPITGHPITPTPFQPTTLGLSATAGQALPNLGLQRVYVLTSSGTCSASEAVMNGLQGVGVQVIQIGKTTCGKPYGFYPDDNCGTTYFTIQFQGINARGFGTYPDGFTPNSGMTASTGTSAMLPGCSINDDLTHELGDQNESLLFVALGYRANGVCSTPPAGLSAGLGVKRSGRDVLEGRLVRSPLREMRIMRSR
jgi:carboxyl-terminal processing protease